MSESSAAVAAVSVSRGAAPEKGMSPGGAGPAAASVPAGATRARDREDRREAGGSHRLWRNDHSLLPMKFTGVTSMIANA